MQNIRELYSQPPVRLVSDSVKYLQDIANDLGRGSLRRCRMLLQNTARRARERQGIGEGDKVTVAAADLDRVEHRLRRESNEQATVSDRLRRAASLKQA